MKKIRKTENAESIMWDFLLLVLHVSLWRLWSSKPSGGRGGDEYEIVVDVDTEQY